MQRSNLASALALVLCVGVPAASVTAEENTAAEDAMEYRETIMHAMGAHVSAISMHLRGLVEDHGFVDEHAQSLANTAAELSYVFPEGSNVGDSEALPAIWEKPEEFARAVSDAEDATAALAEAASTGDRKAISSAMREVGAACRGCHNNFRKDDD